MRRVRWLARGMLLALVAGAGGCGATSDPALPIADAAARPPRLWPAQPAPRTARNPFRPLLDQVPANAPAPSNHPPPTQPPCVILAGIVEISDGLRAMLEQQPGGATRFVRVGEEAFGFRVVAIERDRAILEREGVQIELRPTAPPAAPSPAATAASPALPEALARHLPPGAEVLDLDTEPDAGGTRYRLRWRPAGGGPPRSAEFCLDAQGNLISLTVEQRHDELPPPVLAAALRAEPDARIAVDVPARLREEAGRRHYEVTLRNAAGRAIVLHLAPDGTLLDRR